MSGISASFVVSCGIWFDLEGVETRASLAPPFCPHCAAFLTPFSPRCAAFLPPFCRLNLPGCDLLNFSKSEEENLAAETQRAQRRSMEGRWSCGDWNGYSCSPRYLCHLGILYGI